MIENMKSFSLFSAHLLHNECEDIITVLNHPIKFKSGIVHRRYLNFYTVKGTLCIKCIVYMIILCPAAFTEVVSGL